MTRAVLIACALFLACDQRADELLAAGIQAVLEDPPKRSAHAADCAKGSPRYGAPNLQLAIDCRPMARDGGAK
jgi:hypothetical protein